MAAPNLLSEHDKALLDHLFLNETSQQTQAVVERLARIKTRPGEP